MCNIHIIFLRVFYLFGQLYFGVLSAYNVICIQLRNIQTLFSIYILQRNNFDIHILHTLGY